MNKTLLTAFVALSCPLLALAGTDADIDIGHPGAASETPPGPIDPIGLIAPSAPIASADDEASPSRSLGVITVQGTRPTSLPTRIPTTTHSATREDIARTVNATDSEDALKYFPSLLVRKRYIGDYNHAILSSRASGTGNSARSVVYADGILLSNFLGNGVGGLSFPPRWGLVTPEEIERVDVMYGPFSAAYPGNSVGAVVDYVTRMPTKFEAHAKVGYVAQPFELYGTNQTFHAWQTSASVGNRAGDWAWWINVNHTDSEGQPQTFVTRRVQDGTSTPSLGTVPVPVTGAIRGANNAGEPWYILGTGTQYHTKQDHLKVKLAYDITPTVRASYVLGLWRNVAEGNPTSYLSGPSGQPVYDGPIQIGDRIYSGAGNSTAPALRPGDFTLTREKLLHTMHGLSVKSHTRGEWDWEIAASLYDYERDDKRQNTGALPGASTGGGGTLAEGAGTGWNTLALKGSWRPMQAQGSHAVDFGYQREAYKLRYGTATLNNYLTDEAGTPASAVLGNTLLQSLYAQDTWKLSPAWKAVLGLRAERWEAFDGSTYIPNRVQPPPPLPPIPALQPHPSRHETAVSPKAALSWQWLPDTMLKASLGRAVRMPTVAELYGATGNTNSQFINDPFLRPERSWTTELSAEKDLGYALTRLTFFAEDTRDALYSQMNVVNSINVTRVQNIDRVATHGLEAALNGENCLIDGLDLWASLTYTDSQIKANQGWAKTPGDTIGKRQPNIPRWRGTALASYRFNPEWSASLGARFAGRQYRTLDNADINGETYMGVSKFFVVDARLRWRVTKQWTAALGIDNLNNAKYWNFHPYPQRSYSAELAFDL